MTYDTHTIVEATSLSHVTDIATNPPLHPTASPDIPQLPLVLYIARVPGSRDVFLTPIKPREKVVTAEDVQSSLYYVHVNSPEDLDEAPRRPSSVNADSSHLLSVPGGGIRRKAAPPTAPSAPPTPPYPVDDGPPHTTARPPSPPRNQILRKPLVPRRSPHRQPKLALPVLPSRPPPPPPDQRHTSLHEDNLRLLRRSDHSDENNPYYRSYEPTLSPNDMPKAGSLTLIRRDPSSNEQWNVASIHDPPIQEVSSAALRNPSAAKRTKRGGAPVYLDISNPSYVHFNRQSRIHSRTSVSSSISSDSDPLPEGIFRRRLYMPGSMYGEHNYGHQEFGSVVSFAEDPDAPMRKSMRHSVDWRSTSSPPLADRRNKGYTFESPWDGRCEFSTGATGRSLKCRHYLANHQGHGVAEVSELRFNLPTNSNRSATALSDKRSSYFHRLHGRSHSSEDGSETPTFIIGEDGRIDLALGQERAGGGFGGKQAKLGKLIIEPEGLKMLDLLVAANVGLWWRAYERL
ncbi:Hypothetical predicted protein [Lecanosticta acicola]|uniref:Uncharacterized protein n=1 Tax=Lecanosticta acicola TaxID=111012 RepID=A0AAI8YZR7_9PEZI|nr:Hypothetical predicted protein [Lecanosticta acicola]